MAIRVSQTPLIIEDQNTSGHLRVGQTALILESVPPPFGHLQISQGVMIFEVTANSLLLTLINGSFQDLLGNLIVNGKITFQLSQTATYTSGLAAYEISQKYVLQENLDINGNIVLFLIWLNSLLSLASTYYKVKVYSSKGQLLWYSPVTILNTYLTVNFDNLIPQF